MSPLCEAKRERSIDVGPEGFHPVDVLFISIHWHNADLALCIVRRARASAQWVRLRRETNEERHGLWFQLDGAKRNQLIDVGKLAAGFEKK